MTQVQVCEVCTYDVAIIGAGPAGIAAAISLASEGSKVVVIDNHPAGGQVATSSNVENVFGVPEGGLPGQTLMSRATDQAIRFGAKLITPFNVVRIEKESDIFTLVASNRERITAAAVCLTIGVSYRRHDATGVDKYSGRGVHYGAPQHNVPNQWEGKRVGLVGGGNSAGQAAKFLASCSQCQVEVFVRGDRLENDMSHYLLQQIAQSPNIKVHAKSVIEEVVGDEERIKKIHYKQGDQPLQMELDYLLIQIGMEPQTGWLRDIELDSRGFILTDRDIPPEKWPDADRQPLRFETSMPGVFAAGDIHSGAPKRMQCAIGEGPAMAVSVYQYIHMLREKEVISS